MLSMVSALEKTRKTRCRVFVEVVTTSTDAEKGKGGGGELDGGRIENMRKRGK